MYPRLISWLMSKKARQRTLNKINKNAARRLHLAGIDREYDFNEIAIITRAGTAASLGFSDKGHLGVGAQADVAIYNINPEKIDPSKDYKAVKKAFKQTAYTIKDGIVVMKEGQLVADVRGKTYWVNSQVADEDLTDRVLKDVKDKFEAYYSIKLSNYPVQDSYLTNPCRIDVAPA